MSGTSCPLRKRVIPEWIDKDLDSLNKLRNELVDGCNLKSNITESEIDSYESQVNIFASKIDRVIRQLQKIQRNDLDEMQDDIANLREMIKTMSQGGAGKSRVRTQKQTTKPTKSKQNR